MTFELSAIGIVRSVITEPIDDDWGNRRARIDLDASRFTSDSLRGLADFSHVEIVFLFHLIGDSTIVTGLRHPRGRADWPKVGIFAQRGRKRPNRIGVTVCRLIHVDDLSIEIEGLDAIDGTPVLDIKPYLREFAPRGEIRQPAWSSELMRGYWTAESR